MFETTKQLGIFLVKFFGIFERDFQKGQIVFPEKRLVWNT